jgi:diguanylate cyclase (GGDEF)-like protein
MAEPEKTNTKDSLREVLDALPGAVFAFRPGSSDDAPVFVNRTFVSKMEARDERELRAKSKGDFWKFIHPDDRDVVRKACSGKDGSKNGVSSFDCRIITVKGNVRLVRVLSRIEREPDGGRLSVNFWLDLGRVLPLQPDLETDPLTGLLSLHSFLSVMEDRRKFQPKGLAVLFIDVINFRSLNLRYGVTSGDDFLCSFGRSLQDCFTDGIAAHFDADHFAVLAPAAGMEKRAGQIRRIVRKFSPTSIDASIGACLWDDPLASAETACNRAKIASDDNRKHENTYFSVFTPEMGKRLELSEYVVSNIDEAVSRGWIKVFYQPIIRSLTGQLCGFEALARWDDPARGLLPPADFIGPLEDAQQIWKLDLCVARQAASNIALRERQGLPEIPVSINLSRMDFLYRDIFGEVESLVRELDIPRRMLHIEITESVMTSRDDQVIKAFKDSGYELWMDDFGSGYSTLNMLKDCHFDVLKLDMAFLRNDTPRSRAIISSIVSMDKRIGNLTLAEGVETPEQAEFLRNAGCEMMQGFFFGKPQHFEEALASCLRKGISIEGARRKSYYDSVGQVDFKRGVALAVVELKDDAFRILFMNDLFRQQAEEDGMKGTDRIEAEINSGGSLLNRDLRRAAATAISSGRNGEVLVQINGNSRLVRCSLLGRSGDDSLFEADIHDCSNIERGLQYSVAALVNLRSFYIGLYYIDLEDGTFKICQYAEASDGSKSVPILDENGQPSSMLPGIFPADSQRYMEFINPQTLSSRFDHTRHGLLRGIFRTLDTDGTYAWMSHRIIRVPNSSKKKALYAVRHMDVGTDKDEAALLNSDAYGHLTSPSASSGDKAALWENLMLGSPLPIFWKDKNRRFLGASRRFIDYYGFSSQSEIIGKTDEDMRWHPGNAPYRDDEEEILRTGKMHESVPGKCISRGVSRNILATKWPMYRNGKVCGLMGYFLDEDMASGISGDANAAKLRLDPETGFPTVESFLDDLGRYEGDCRLHGRQFGIILIHISEFKRIYASFGKEVMVSALKACAGVIRRESGPYASCSRIGTGQFAIVIQCSKREELEDISGRIRNGISAIRRAGGADCTMFAKAIVIPPGKSEGFRSRLLGAAGEFAADPENGSNGVFSGNKLVQALIDDIPIGCYVVRPDCTLTFWNREASKVLGYQPEEMIGRKCTDMPLGCTFTNSSPITLNRCPAMEALSSGQPKTVEMFMKNKAGKDVLIRSTMVPVKEGTLDDTEVAVFFTTLSDQRYSRSLVRAIYEVATRDPLTGLPGRKYMEACLDAALEGFRRTGHAFAVLYAAIDGGPRLSEKDAENAGNEILKRFGAMLRTHGRKTDLFCRWGGREFVGLLQIRTPDSARKAAERFLKIARNCQEHEGGNVAAFTSAIGIALPREGDSVISIIERADRAMYKARCRGDNEIETDYAN